MKLLIGLAAVAFAIALFAPEWIPIIKETIANVLAAWTQGALP